MAMHSRAIDEERSSQPHTERPLATIPEPAADPTFAPSNPGAHRAERSSDIVPAFSRALAWGDSPGALPRGSALVDLAEPFISASRIGPARPGGTHHGLVHANGRRVSPSLARFQELDAEWLRLPIGDDGRLEPGVSLPTVVERALDPALAMWVEGLEPILPGTFYVLPTSANDRCDLLYVAPDDCDDEVVFALEVAHDGTLDLRVSYPSVDIYLAHAFGAIDFDPEFHAADEEVLAQVQRRFFDGRRSLFAFEA